MKILLTTYPERTHFLIMGPFAWALRNAGHEVRFAVQPGFAEVVTQAGLTATPVGPDRHLWQALGRIGNMLLVDAGLPPPYNAVERSDDELDLDEMVNGYRFQVDRWHKMSNVPLIGPLVEFARQWRPDLVLWEPVTYAGAIAAKACGAAHGRILFAADMYGIARQHFRRLSAQQERVGTEAIGDPLGEWIAGYVERYGFDFDEQLITGQFTLDVVPEPLQIHADGLEYQSMQYVPYGGPAEIPRWLWDPPRRPRVGLTLGLTTADHGVHHSIGLADVLTELASLDVEVVAAVSGAAGDIAALDREVPDNVRIVDFVPWLALAQSCSAVVHHAGLGSLATAVSAGVPQVTVPWDGDQPLLSRRLVDTGAGLTIHSDQATGVGIRNAVQRVLGEPSFAEAARCLQHQVGGTCTQNAMAAGIADLVAKCTG